MSAKMRQSLQRSAGSADLALDFSGSQCPKIRRLRQEGSAKVFLPRGAVTEAIFLNTSGGLTGGDTFSCALELGANLDVTATTQTAERAYASTEGSAVVRNSFVVGQGASLAWLPQETILYENSQLSRLTEVHLSPSATALACEMVILGRHAMEEYPQNLRFNDQRRYYVSGRLIWSEAIRICPATLARHGGGALLEGARCFATIVMIGQDAEHAGQALAPIQSDVLTDTAVSAWNGRLIVRLRARHSWPMRIQVARILNKLRSKPLPRVWQMNGDIL